MGRGAAWPARRRTRGRQRQQRTDDGAASAGTEATAPEAAARPDWLPEQFWENETPAYEKLGRSYAELRRAFDGKQDKLREQIVAELREGVPESPEGYAFDLPKDAIPEGFEAVAPPADDPLLGEVRQVFHELGARPDQWGRVLNAFVRWQVGQAPDMAAERAKVGEGAEQRIEAVDRWMARQLGDETMYRAVMDRATSADFVLAMEQLMRSMGHAVQLPVGAPGAGAAPSQVTAFEAQEAMRHADYYHEQKGAPLRARVDAFFRAGGILPGMRRKS